MACCAYLCEMAAPGRSGHFWSKYPRVPLERRADTSLVCRAFDSPKSMIFTVGNAECGSLASSRFSGLRSRWMTPWSCMKRMASPTSDRMEAASSSPSVPRFYDVIEQFSSC